jgi:hypothetical protein
MLKLEKYAAKNKAKNRKVAIDGYKKEELKK